MKMKHFIFVITISGLNFIKAGLICDGVFLVVAYIYFVSDLCCPHEFDYAS